MYLTTNFQYHLPESLEEALQLLTHFKKDIAILAGGTDLIVNMKKNIISPPHILSLKRINSLKNIEIIDGNIHIGCCVKVANIEGSLIVQKHLNALKEAAGVLGSPPIRNLATIGGNIVSARPAADLICGLLVFDTKLVLKSEKEIREVPLKEFFLGPGKTVIRDDELLEKVVIPIPKVSTGSYYIKLGPRNALFIGIINVAVLMELDLSGYINNAAISLGAVAPYPMRASKAEKLLVGEKPKEKLFEEVAHIASTESSPIDDFRGSAEYRKEMVKVLTKRGLIKTYQLVKNKV